ncbi:MAG: hypothetical protein K2Q03_06305 [Sphingobacteriaceae bacterium]|nr:hypothetical protein [Sphingobacteriaceae bacterium]
MKKTISLLALFLASIIGVQAQKKAKVDLDSYRFNATFQRLPTTVYPFEMRTFNVEVETSSYFTPKMPVSSSSVVDNVSVDGWKRSNNNATVKIKIHFGDFTQTTPTIKSRLYETKDDKGNIKESYTLYWAETSFSGRGMGSVSRFVNPLEAADTTKEEVKKNKFLDATTTAPSSTTDSKYTDERTLNLNFEYVFKTKEFKSSREAESDYNVNGRTVFSTYINQYVNDAVSEVKSSVNYRFGFKPQVENAILWIIADKTEEGDANKQAYDAVVAIFKNAVIDEDINITAKKLQPVIDYFESLKTKYPDDDKPSRKIRYSAYYNLAQIYYYLDQPEKTIKEGQGLVENDYDKRDGHYFVKEAGKLIELFNKTKLNSRHQPIFK